MRGSTTSVALGLLAAAANAAPFKSSTVKRQDGGKIVAAHFMVCHTPNLYPNEV